MRPFVSSTRTPFRQEHVAYATWGKGKMCYLQFISECMYGAHAHHDSIEVVGSQLPSFIVRPRTVTMSDPHLCS